MKRQCRLIMTGLALGGAMLFAPGANASYITGGDAADQASAGAIVDIVFAIDTSGSMSDDITAIGNAAQNVVQNINCPYGDIWVRARFMGISTTYGSVFNETVRQYVLDAGGTPSSNHQEDNGWAVVDLVNWYNWNNDAQPGQDYYKAVVTIGDEGTEDGQPVNQADYDAAYAANQAAILSDVLLFAWVTDDPYSGVPGLFQTMAEGGSLGGHTFLHAGGAYVAGGDQVEAKLESIICSAGQGGTVPDSCEYGLLIALLGIVGFYAYDRRRANVS